MPHCNINIIKCADTDQFAFSAAVTYLSILHQLVFKLDLYEFFSRHSKEDHFSVKSFFYFRITQCESGSHQCSHLCIVTTAVGSSCFRISRRAVWNRKCIQFTYQGNCDRFFFASFQVCLCPGDRQPIFYGKT